MSQPPVPFKGRKKRPTSNWKGWPVVDAAKEAIIKTLQASKQKLPPNPLDYFRDNKEAQAAVDAYFRDDPDMKELVEEYLFTYEGKWADISELDAPEDIKIKIFDTVVNRGNDGITVLQQVLNALEPEDPIITFGQRIGDATNEKLSRVLAQPDGENRFRTAFTAALKKKYEATSQPPFRRGHQTRAERWPHRNAD